MSGNAIGGAKAAATNKKRHGADYYARIGAQGGAAGKTGGFYQNRELARIAGAKGGRISRRGKKKAHAEFQAGFNEPSAFKRVMSNVKLPRDWGKV